MDKLGSMKPGHLNMRSLMSDFAAIIDLIQTERFSIFAVSETWLCQDITNDAVSINNYNLFRSTEYPAVAE
ncbi:unnamed protein product [Acanthoscelides obtectus]|uniref:Reverse transcriptase domain-containing protein n=1 Tax=Acanthoscelides obtectus TaxID=200917 RepID=A0A9P0PXT9_ACAOB|nr:unnamed protein product [Acanthoscelides obtectus]CAK1664037.1 hypothetical protein AOBTE_LOCUS24015 [Acanthoscelides obtectus]